MGFAASKCWLQGVAPIHQALEAEQNVSQIADATMLLCFRHTSLNPVLDVRPSLTAVLERTHVAYSTAFVLLAGCRPGGNEPTARRHVMETQAQAYINHSAACL